MTLLQRLWYGLRNARGPAQPDPPPSKRALAHQALLRLNLADYAQLRSAHGFGRPIRAVYSNIDIYAERLIQAYQIVHESRAISPEWAAGAAEPTTLGQWLVSSDGFYLDVPHALERWRTAGIRLCESLESADYEAVGLPEHNARMLSRVLTNITELTQALAEAI